MEVANGEILGAEGCCPGFIDLIFRGSERCEEHMFCSWEMSGSSKSLVGIYHQRQGQLRFSMEVSVWPPYTGTPTQWRDAGPVSL